jgi:methylated-DNA-[protein]-cysteine S-methyltransferase
MPDRRSLAAGACDARLATPFAVIGVRTRGERVVEIAYLPLRTAALAPRNALAAAACRQIERYLADPGFRFDLPLATEGTPFRRAVWREIARIPAGQTRTYGELAARLRSGPRAVGGACGDNPVPLVVPCHRVVARDGPGGFMHRDGGFALSVKRWLLAHEGILPAGA